MRQRPELPNLLEAVVDEQALRDTFEEDTRAGLARAKKSVPAKHLYDARGSELFDLICDAPEYYPTRTERQILRDNARAISDAIGSGATLIEPGAGTGEKAESLLDTLDAPTAFVPIEISRTALDAGAERVAINHPEVEVRPYCADFTDLPALADDHGHRVVFFPGSTIGNFEKEERRTLLRSFSRLAGHDGLLLIGFDLAKNRSILEAAYDDQGGLTAAFNLNLLSRINRQLQGDFDLGRFEHAAPWSGEHQRIEMHLISQSEHRVSVAGDSIQFMEGETIHTESSHKFTTEQFDEELASEGMALQERWTDDKGWFCVGLYRPTA